MGENLLNSEEILYQEAISIIDTGRKNVIESIYNETTKSYYALGKLIIEKEQDGIDKAKYGTSTLENLSKKLTIKYGKN